jgi:ABC-2 type transport system permease protein
MTDFPVESHVVAPVVISTWRRMYWSVRRELWESRSIYLAPLLVAAVFVFGFLIGAFARPSQRHGIKNFYDFAAIVIMATTFIVAVFYCLEALNSERRDRSILFWKSLPVSDLTTVLSKASIPLVVLPLVTFAITIVTQSIMLLISTAALMGSGRSAATLWNGLPLFQTWPGLFYHLLVIHGLWYAPFFGWLLLVSAWARRAVFLWAALPLFAIGVVEKIAFNTSHFAAMLANRMSGGGQGAPVKASGMSMDLMPAGGPVQFLVSPDFWIGLAVAAAFFGAAVRLRRKREPI